MRDRIGVDPMVDADDGISTRIGESLGTRKEIKMAPPEGPWPLSDRVLAIGRKTNTHSVTSVSLW